MSHFFFQSLFTFFPKVHAALLLLIAFSSRTTLEIKQKKGFGIKWIKLGIWAKNSETLHSGASH
jgi:hypothetical protein